MHTHHAGEQAQQRSSSSNVQVYQADRMGSQFVQLLFANKLPSACRRPSSDLERCAVEKQRPIYADITCLVHPPCRITRKRLAGYAVLPSSQPTVLRRRGGSLPILVGLVAGRGYGETAVNINSYRRMQLGGELRVRLSVFDSRLRAGLFRCLGRFGFSSSWSCRASLS